MKPPIAQKKPHPHQLHEDIRPDDYYWLREKENPEVIQYLESENAYFAEVMNPLRPLQETIYQDMLSRIPEAEKEIAAQDGPYFYYSRINPGQQYRIYLRRRATHRNDLENVPEEVVLDVNQLSHGEGFLSVTTVLISPDHRRAAYLENRDGTDRYMLYVKDLASGTFLDRPIANVFIEASVAFNASGDYLYYLTVDESQRPYRLWRHHLLHERDDVLLYEENDIAFSLNLMKSRSGAYLFLVADTKTTSEVRYLPTDQPEEPFRLFEARRSGILYKLEHWNDQFLVLTNDGAQNFTLLTTPAQAPDPHRKTPLIPYQPARYLQAVLPFAKGLVLYGRQNGLTQIWTYRNQEIAALTFDEPLYTVVPGPNRSYSTNEVLIQYQSLITPKTDYAIDLITGERTILAQDPVRNYDASRYQQQRLWATASDGTRIPLSMVALKETLKQTPAPLILYGYGSYGINSNPAFDATRLALLDRGVIYVIAHVRGGSEMGHGWYEDGKLFNKKNTFTDFIAAAENLIDQGFTTAERLAARGRSAGGLLMGAILNMKPDLFRVVVPGVPFVDVVTTMLDASIPLTSLEWDEWGNPQDKDYYIYMKSYSPYDNVAAKPYPHMLVYTGLNDPRVGYFEPAKWVARLRDTKTDNNTLLLKTHMGAGHGGSSGRFERLKELAEEYAFILNRLGAVENLNLLGP